MPSRRKQKTVHTVEGVLGRVELVAGIALAGFLMWTIAASTDVGDPHGLARAAASLALPVAFVAVVAGLGMIAGKKWRWLGQLAILIMVLVFFVRLG